MKITLIEIFRDEPITYPKLNFPGVKSVYYQVDDNGDFEEVNGILHYSGNSEEHNSLIEDAAIFVIFRKEGDSYTEGRLFLTGKQFTPPCYGNIWKHIGSLNKTIDELINYKSVN